MSSPSPSSPSAPVPQTPAGGTSPESDAVPEASPLRPGIQAVVVVLAALAVYIPALGLGFVYDDFPLVEANPWIRSPAWLGDIFTQQIFGFIPNAEGSQAFYRPLVHVLLMVIHGVAGMATWAYHLAPVLLHATASLTVWALARRMAAGSTATALAAGLLFAVHPVHVEAVAWVSALMDVSAATAGLGMLWLLTSRPLSPLRAVAGAVLWLVAALFKEPAVLLLPMLAAWELMATGPTHAGVWRERALRFGPLGVAVLLYAVLRLNAVGWASVNSGWDTVPRGIAFLNTFPLLAHHASLLLWPAVLSVFHPFEPATSVVDGRVLAGVAVALGMGAGLVMLRRRAPAAWLGLAWLALPLLPALHLRALSESAVAERYLYLPSAGFCLLAAFAWGTVARLARPAVAWAFGLAVLLGATARTQAQVGTWQSDVTLWVNAVESSPVAVTPLVQLGDALLRAGETEEAILALERARELKPEHLNAANQLARAYVDAGRPAEARELMKAAVRAHPDASGFHFVLGLAHKRLGEKEAALVSFQEAARLSPSSGDALLELGEALVALGRAAEALPPLEEAMKRLADASRAHRALAQAHRALNHEDQARAHERSAQGSP
ncbi:tetratricopeptide repeat protein [Myxococcus landrumensis]|uniref:Tetratricopeptide repeat protein n=1 Tax=Myxococcus landrumensis TaxID=2813577 RepID=A0ABX7NE67_9BACT|nr:tetratricopeptide repeat protein [Myxococcus landrumus]QSQ17117.1 tetratricopeptide repeat protein [Myxococcus landrumus]